MVNKTMARVFVTEGNATRKKTVFERVISPEKTAVLDYSIVINGLRALYPHESTITIEVYGV